MYQPSLNDDEKQGGIQLGLRLATSDKVTSFELSFIGGGEAHDFFDGLKGEDKDSAEHNHSDPKAMVIGPDFDGFSILTNEDDGFCNVIIHQGDNGTLPLFNLCNENEEGVT